MDNRFIVNHDKDKKEKITIFYTMIGQHSSLDEDGNPIVKKDSNSFAKKVKSNTSTRYFIKVGTHGKIYNPIGLYSEGTSNKFLARAGKKAWDYKEVNSKVFDMYLNFLKTKNTAWLTNAQRELN